MCMCLCVHLQSILQSERLEAQKAVSKEAELQDIRRYSFKSEHLYDLYFMFAGLPTGKGWPT